MRTHTEIYIGIHVHIATQTCARVCVCIDTHPHHAFELFFSKAIVFGWWNFYNLVILCMIWMILPKIASFLKESKRNSDLCGQQFAAVPRGGPSCRQTVFLFLLCSWAAAWSVPEPAGSLVALRIPGPAGSSLPKPDPLSHSRSSVLVLPDRSCFLCGFLSQGSREQRLGSHVRLACLFIFFLIWFVISSQEARPAFSLRSGSEPSDKGHISLCLCWWGPRPLSLLRGNSRS